MRWFNIIIGVLALGFAAVNFLSVASAIDDHNDLLAWLPGMIGTAALVIAVRAFKQAVKADP